MAEPLYVLPNGDAIDPTKVTAVIANRADQGERVLPFIHVYMADRIISVRCEIFEEAAALCDKIIQAVNAKRGA
jgi:predicted RNase H-related nuclease YkuK (DUF458 family)